MARTNIDIDEDLVRRVMGKYHLKTKKDAVDLALRKAAGPEITREQLLALEGVGWGGDLGAIKNSPIEEFSINQDIPALTAEHDR